MKKLKQIFLTGVLATLGLNAMATDIYNSFGNYNGNAFSMGNGQEVGNQISFSPNLWVLTNFTIQYNTPNTFLSTNLGIDVRFYLNNGTPTNGFASPGPLFFDSGWYFNGVAGLPGNFGGNNGFNNVYYTSADFYGGSLVNMPGGYLMPTNFTFSVTFTNTGLGGTNLINLPLANNTAGISLGDYWFRNGSGVWTLATNASSAANFVVDFGGTVPEPATFGLAAVGGALLLGASKLRRKR